MSKIVFIAFALILIVIIVVAILSKRKKKPVATYAWAVSPDSGSVCSVPCGGGKRYLNVYCEAVDKSGKPIKQVDDSLCTGVKPSSEEDCNTQSCEWYTSPWGSCSVSCGVDGVQTRTVSCPVPGSCTGTAPESSQKCESTALCPWTYSKWSPEDCAICGKGTQTRTGQCLRDGKTVDNSNCGSEGELSKSCTSANTCSWETSASWLPYPASLLNLKTFVNKKVKLLIATNQSSGLGVSQNSASSVVSVDKAQSFTVNYSETPVPYLIFSSDNLQYFVGADSSNKIGSYKSAQILAIVVVNGKLSVALMPSTDVNPMDYIGYISYNGSNILFSKTEPSNAIDLVPIPQ